MALLICFGHVYKRFSLFCLYQYFWTSFDPSYIHLLYKKTKRCLKYIVKKLKLTIQFSDVNFNIQTIYPDLLILSPISTSIVNHDFLQLLWSFSLYQFWLWNIDHCNCKNLCPRWYLVVNFWLTKPIALYLYYLQSLVLNLWSL